MKPRRFEFHSPECLDDALTLAQRFADDCLFFAGGTEAMVGMKERVIDAGHVINLKRIQGLRELRAEDGRLVIGALITHQEIADSPLVRNMLPGVAALSDQIANIRVRSAGTLAGNLCFAEPNADPPPMLAALDAHVELLGPQGLRQVPVRDFFEGPYDTVRADTECMTNIVIPVADGCRSAYRKMAFLNRPSAGVAAVRTSADDAPAWEVWAGSITGMPQRLDHVCAYLNDHDAVDKAQLMHAAAQDMAPLDVMEGVYGSAAYRKHLVAVLAVRSSLECLS